ncbi:phosphatase PAP2 family protein [Streptomyces sp. NPDC048664]|uniref:phosphatase PAP2 family protein n=1 Tax=Streptomyces sp. NPDC048664 TaxID=3154505 RepID=UPI0034490499
MTRGAASRTAAVVALVAFVLLTAAVAAHGGAPVYGDEALLRWSVGHRPSTALAAARALTATGTGLVPYLLAVLAGLLAARSWRGRAGAIATCVACLALGQLVRYGLMSLMARPRPATADRAVETWGSSFPSGHATTAAMAAGLVVLAVLARAPRGGPFIVAAVVGWGALIGLTRVYLGVHWLSDVIGGWLLAVSWLGLWAYAARRLPRPREPGGGKPGPAHRAQHHDTPTD